MSIYNIFEKKNNRCDSYQGSTLLAVILIRCRIFVSLEFGSSSDLGLDLGVSCHSVGDGWCLRHIFFGSDFSGSRGPVGPGFED